MVFAFIFIFTNLALGRVSHKVNMSVRMGVYKMSSFRLIVDYAQAVRVSVLYHKIDCVNIFF